MAVFVVSYDLNKAGQDYKGLYEELKRSTNWWHYLDSTWLIYTSESANGLFQRIKKHIDNNDSVFIVEVNNNYSGRLSEKAWEWIKKYVK